MSVSYINNSEISPFEFAANHFNNLVSYLQSKSISNVEHGEIEEHIRQEGIELQRLLLQGFLNQVSNNEEKAEVYNNDGVHLNHIIPSSSHDITSLFGGITVTRNGYQQRRQSRVYPLDATLKFGASKYTDGIKYRVLHEVVKASYDAGLQAIDSTTGGHVPKRQMQKIVIEEMADFDDFYLEHPLKSAAKPDDLLIISTDGKGIVMRSDGLREATANAEKSQKLKTRLSAGEKTNRKRMAQVCTVYDVAKNPRTPEMIMQKSTADSNITPFPVKPRNKRVWASVEKPASESIESTFLEALKRDPDREREWVFLVDGNKHQIATIKKLRMKYHVKGLIMMDFIHVLEYLWSAGWELFEKNDPKIESWVEEKALAILSGKAGQVAKGLGVSAHKRNLKKRDSIDRCIRYLKANKTCLQYDKALSSGYPIATGVIEGACRHLIKDRFDITGARWSLKGAEAMLKLRSLKSSGDLAEYLKFHKQKEVKRLYSGFSVR